MAQSLLTIASKMKFLRLKGNYTGLLPTTTSISISSPSGFSSDFNWRISRTAAMETKSKCFSIESDCPVNPSWIDSSLPGFTSSRDQNKGRANPNPDAPIDQWPTVQECNHTLDEMCLHDTNYHTVARRIFGKSKEHREGWMRLREKHETEKKKWIESTGRELGLSINVSRNAS